MKYPYTKTIDLDLQTRIYTTHYEVHNVLYFKWCESSSMMSYTWNMVSFTMYYSSNGVTQVSSTDNQVACSFIIPIASHSINYLHRNGHWLRECLITQAHTPISTHFPAYFRQRSSLLVLTQWGYLFNVFFNPFLKVSPKRLPSLVSAITLW